MSKRTQQIFLVVLAVILVAVLYVNFSGPRTSALPGFAPVDAKFEPLKVEDPSLRLDLLEKVRRTEYKGEHHDIFSFGPPGPTPAQKAASSAGAPGARDLFWIRDESDHAKSSRLFQQRGRRFHPRRRRNTLQPLPSGKDWEQLGGI
jgi:hypothetical protein